ncbi:uncharacterized protein K02A2.6-like [Teleopsis dalmanni]|uniref:uncharacterized protein K02A2.6-like n=1 Tax=Teleopsis dalmanni TaxID=139649 RepID=UPI0018CEEAC6|nr:uncharacterized protein K02A2.6-like [Teleopsis dalmanni]
MAFSIVTAPFHPASNGLAERFVRTFKTSVKKNLDDSMPISEAVIKFLVTYRSMPNSNNKSPAELLHGRTAQTLLTQILPVTKLSKKQPVTTKFGKDCKVFLRNYSSGPKWVEGIIEKFLGNRVYLVKTPTGQCKRHQNQLQARQSTPPQPTAYEPSKQHQ